MSGLGAAMCGGNPGAMRGDGHGVARQERDFYPTPPEATAALLAHEQASIRRLCGGERPVVWEPACGDGRMARVIEGFGFDVVTSDIQVPEGAPAPDFVADFLATPAPPVCPRTGAPARALITNPPYERDLCARFVEHAAGLGLAYVALLLKATYWHAAARRGALWDACGPSGLLAVGFRLDFLDLGAPAVDVTWNVWDGRPRGSRVEVLRKPWGRR